MERQRCAIEFCVRLGKSESETLQIIHQAYGVRISPRAISGLFQPWKGSSEARKPPVPLSSWSLRQTVCSTFSRSEWIVVRCASLAKGGTSKKRPSPHLHKVLTRSNKVSPQTFQTAVVYIAWQRQGLWLITIQTRPLDRNDAPWQTKPQLSWLQPKSGHESRMVSTPRLTDWPTDWLTDSQL
jgi:hypothetical protein